ncbi:Peptide transporter YePEPT [Frankliniella fusca]|uniref:Peptide transporter YePEPT n=1 Tax=Frankliniella fusca TaxID=407009 RepID=A0AAE1LE27_9NEOP|nr:Peptide transporter YePEPT [Frankliniella fusca]
MVFLVLISCGFIPAEYPIGYSNIKGILMRYVKEHIQLRLKLTFIFRLERVKLSKRERSREVSWLTSLLHADILSSRFDQQANSPGSWTKLALKPLLLKRIQNASLETCVRIN